MYGYEWTEENGIFRLTINAKIQKEIRPVFHEELDFFGMDQYWDYPKDTTAPLLWAEGVRRYVLNGVCVAEAQGGGFYTKPTIKRLTEERLKLVPIDTDRLYEVNRQIMLSLEQKAVQFIQTQYEHYLPLGFSFVCAFSGGKDSLVLLDLMTKALAPKDYYVVFSNTGMELSDTLKTFVDAQKHWPGVRFKEAKCHIDVIIEAIDYNPDGYLDENGEVSERKKLYFLRRLLPFVEKRVNLIELAPKGTGKSYVFEKISKRGWLISGGTVSRASLIYDNAKKTGGLLTRFDFVGFDEVQSITFEQPGQIQQALKHYMEYGEIKGFDASLSSGAGVIVLGNIDADRFDTNKNMVANISEVFGESATLDRFHGFIPGWEIPRMTTGMIAKGWAINTEYFAEVMHALRDDLTYSAVVDAMIDFPSNADKRHMTAIKRLCTAFLKLLFPHVQTPNDIDRQEFIDYCLNPAIEMRSAIYKQLCIIDAKEYDVPSKRIPEIVCK